MLAGDYRFIISASISSSPLWRHNESNDANAMLNTQDHTDGDRQLKASASTDSQPTGKAVYQQTELKSLVLTHDHLRTEEVVVHSNANDRVRRLWRYAEASKPSFEHADQLVRQAASQWLVAGRTARREPESGPQSVVPSMGVSQR